MKKSLLILAVICCIGMLSGCDDKDKSPELDLMINVEAEPDEIYLEDATDITNTTEEIVTDIDIGDNPT